MKHPPHPLEAALTARVRLLATTLRPSTLRHYEHTAALFVAWLREAFPEVRRDPHMLGWL